MPKSRTAPYEKTDSDPAGDGVRHTAPLPPAGLQHPGTSRGDGLHRAGIGTEPPEGPEGPQGSLGEKKRLGQAPLRGLRQLLFLGRKFFLTSLGNWKPWVPPRAIIRLCSLTGLKIKDPHPGALGAGRRYCVGWAGIEPAL